MANPIDTDNFKQKSFWQKPEGVTGTVFLVGIAAALGFVLVKFGGALAIAAANTVYLAIMLLVLALIVYMVLDPKMRNLVGYMYKSVMRWITGMFVTIDPVGILKNYVDDLADNLRKMSKQIAALRGQMRKLSTIMDDNNKEIKKNMALASAAQKKGNQSALTLSTRKAARLKESNAKYKNLHAKMDVMHKILSKMYQNSEILLEDTKDQVQLKEQERKAIRGSHSAMKSAMSVISGDPDKRAMFDAAMENIADDVANKVGEMERFMEMSSSFMDSVDLQNGVFEEEGLKMLEKFEKQSSILLMGDSSETLDLDSPRPEYRDNSSSSSNSSESYDNLFE